jgi:hypothetical protein
MLAVWQAASIASRLQEAFIASFFLGYQPQQFIVVRR